jgi:hypothetical protein
MAATEAPVPPLVKPQGRNGAAIPVGLVYNSQNWRQDSGVNWQLGSDVGYGFGWQMLVGSVVPYYAAYPSGVDHYVYTDATGAQYRLDQNNGSNVWGSTQGIYVWFDANTNILHFRDGSFWVMGCTSGGEEADAGTMYPTVIEDVSGNQVLVTYDTAPGLPYSVAGQIFTPNTSSRITSISDGRTVSTYGTYPLLPTYSMGYSGNHVGGATPHLSSVTNNIGTAENYGFTVAQGSQGPPFGTDSNYSGSGGRGEILALWGGD